jgi:hypothetical protein
MGSYNENNRGRAVAKAVSVLAGVAIVVWTAVLIVAGVRTSYQYEREIYSYWSLADKSSTITAKTHYVDQFVQVLEQQGLNGDYNAILYPTPDNSFDLNLQALKTLQGRLREIERMNVTSFEYQTAIQQITAQEQGEAKQMLDVFEGAWYKRHHPMLWDWILGLQVGVGLLLVLPGIGFGAMIYGWEMY